MSNSLPRNLEVKTWGLVAMPNIHVRHASGFVDFEIAPDDFNRLISLYIWGSTDKLFFQDADTSKVLQAVFEEDVGLLILNGENQIVCKFADEDWVVAVQYVFENTNLLKDDVRLDLIDLLRFFFSKDKKPTQPGLRQVLLNWLLSLEITDGWEGLMTGQSVKTRRFTPNA